MSSANRDDFTSSFSIWMPFISFSCLIALAWISSTILARSGNSGHSYLVSIVIILGVQFGDLPYIHSILQPSPLSISRTFMSFRTEPLYPLDNKSSFFTPSAPASGILCYTFFLDCSLPVYRNVADFVCSFCTS